MTETLACRYLSDSTQRDLSNEYQHVRINMVLTNRCVPVLWTKVASVLEGYGQTEHNTRRHARLTPSVLGIGAALGH